MTSPFPTQAKFVIIGGGVIGCATAYHLAKNGCRDVVLIEKADLTSGTTWHAAGAVAQYRSDSNAMALAKYAVDIIPELEAETEQQTGWRQTGGMRVAATAERRAEYARTITTANSFGLEMGLISPSEVKEYFPLMNVDDLDCALYIPSDGLVSPTDLTNALAKGARKNGSKIVTDTTVTGFDIKDGRITGVKTDKGDIKCEGAALCAGIWSRQLARMAGANIPILASYHCYFITEPIEGTHKGLPFIRDPDRWHYAREEVGGLMVGQYEPNPVAFDQTDVPNDFVFHLAQENIEQFSPWLEPFYHRLPILQEVGIKTWFNGLESFTEDQNPVLGELPEVDGLFTACGFNAYGVSVGAGFGMALGEWMMNGEQPFDLWSLDVRRFSKMHGAEGHMRARALEGQGDHYQTHFPHKERKAGRPLRRSALYDRLAGRGAVFGEKIGWERPNWFAPEGMEPRDEPSFGHANWFSTVGDECRACREQAVVFDQSSFAKLMVIGKDAEATLQHICAGNIAKAPGRTTYTQMLNDKGGIEADVIVSRISDNEFYLVTGTAFGLHDSHHIRRHMPKDANATLVDVTSAYGVLGLMGPRARDILSKIAETDLSNEAFPFGHVREFFVSGAPVRALRVSFVGELGWELHIPTEYMASVYDAMIEAGAEYGLRDAGYRAIDSLRLEKGYRVWSGDIGPSDNPFEAGLGFAVSFKKSENYVGRDALTALRETMPKRQLVTFSLQATGWPVMGNETIYRNGEQVGWIATGGYGHTIESAIGLGYVCNEGGVDDAFIMEGDYELDVAMNRHSAKPHMVPLYDPNNENLRD